MSPLGVEDKYQAAMTAAFLGMAFAVIGLVGYVVLCWVVARYWRSGRGRSFWAGFWLSVLATPLSGWVVGLLLQRDDETLSKKAVQVGTMKECACCAEPIKAQAAFCRYCGREVRPQLVATAAGGPAVSPTSRVPPPLPVQPS